MFDFAGIRAQLRDLDHVDEIKFELKQEINASLFRAKMRARNPVYQAAPHQQQPAGYWPPQHNGAGPGYFSGLQPINN